MYKKTAAGLCVCMHIFRLPASMKNRAMYESPKSMKNRAARTSGWKNLYDRQGQSLREWNIPDNYIARCFVILGYCDGEYPQPKPRKTYRNKIIE